MSFIDDLNKAVGMFDNQMQTFKQTQAFAKASEQINEANTNLTKEMEKRQAIQGAAQTLAQDLLVAGAPVSRIQAAFQAFSPQAPPSSAEMIGVGIQTDNKKLVQTGIDQDKALGQASQDFKKELLGMQVANRPGQSDLPERKFKAQQFAEFQRSNKMEFEALTRAEGALSLLNTSKDPAAVNAALFGMLKLAGNVGAISDKELDLVVPGSGSTVRKILRRGTVELTQKSMQSDREYIKNFMSTLGNKIRNKTVEKAQGFAKQRSKLIGVDSDVLYNDLLLGIPSFDAGNKSQSAATSNQSSGGLNLRNFKMGN